MKYAFTISLSIGIFVLAISAPEIHAQPYVISADGIEVTDQKTGLIWRRCAEGASWNGSTCVGVASALTHESALRHAAEQASSTGKTWRLPNVKELASIADRSRSNPAIDTTAFPATPASLFWTASPSVGIPTCDWGVHFDDGSVGHDIRVASDAVRLVRTGQ